MFQSWEENGALELKLLRMKCIALLALSLMLRPSDIAPKSSMTFQRKQIRFQDDGSVQISFHGIKNDTSRDGFCVKLPPSTVPTLCPVAALKAYMGRTAAMAEASGAVFISLSSPFKAISSQSVANILNETLTRAGLYPTYTAKDFRPTGATIQVREGVDPKTVMKMGRWKTDTVFFEHYVHSEPPQEFADNVLLYNDI